MKFAEGSDLELTTTDKVSSQLLPGHTMTSHAIANCSKLVRDSRNTYRPQCLDCRAQVVSSSILQKPEHPVHHNLSVAINQQDDEMKRIVQVGKAGLVTDQRQRVVI